MHACACVCVLIKPHKWMFVAGWAHSSTHGLSWGPHRHCAGLDLSRDQCQQAHAGNTLHWCGACMAAHILLMVVAVVVVALRPRRLNGIVWARGFQLL